MLQTPCACEIDWAAWGTWAAVVVALGIALADRVASFYRRRQQTRLIALLVLGNLTTAKIRLDDLATEIADGGVPHGYAAFLAVFEDKRIALQAMGNGLTLPVLETMVERVPDISRKLGEALTQTLAALRVVQLGAADPMRTPEGEDMPPHEAMTFVHAFREAVADAIAVTDDALATAGKIVGSR